jgi:hypothetical protein
MREMLNTAVRREPAVEPVDPTHPAPRGPDLGVRLAPVFRQLGVLLVLAAVASLAVYLANFVVAEADRDQAKEQRGALPPAAVRVAASPDAPAISAGMSVRG